MASARVRLDLTRAATVLADGQTRLADGRVLVVGGMSNPGDPVGTAEVEDPATDTWTNLPGSPTTPRAAPGLFTLPNGKVLVAGGGQVASLPQVGSTATAEILDPATGQFTPSSWSPASAG